MTARDGLLTAGGVSLAAAIFLLINGQALAADSDAPGSLEEVVVTGTAIKRLDAEKSLPVQVLRAEDVQRTGATNVEELLRDVSAASSSGSTTTAQGTGNLTGAISTVSLRGLGSSRTLVLINGKRSAVYGGGSIGEAGSSVDISAIPVAAIERVEILKDGASSIYGSDAIAGVVNFILKSNFQGLQATAAGGTPTRSGGGTWENVNLYGGIGDLKTDRFNVAGGFNFDHNATILGSSRPFAARYSPAYGNDVTSSFAFPANVAIPPNAVYPAGATRNPLAGNCPATGINDVNFPNQCRFDNSPYDSLQPDQKKYSGNLNAHYAVTDDSQLYLEATYSQVKTLTQVQPVPLSYGNPLLPGNPYIAYLANLLATQYPGYNNPAAGPGTGAFLLPPSSPYYPTAWAADNGLAGQPLNLIYRDFANGVRQTQDKADTVRLVAGWKGNAYGFDYDTSVLYGQVVVKENLLTGYPLYSKIMPLLDTGTINPFGATTDPAALAAAKATEFVGQSFNTKTSIASLNGTVSRKLFDLPGGSLAAALGGELRRETFRFDPATEIQGGDVTGQGGNQLPEDVSRMVESAYFEVNAPIIKSLEADAAVRYDHYQTVGSTVNPKGSIRWQPASWGLLRASVGSGFRAPSLTDLYAGQATSVTGNGTRDPVKCPAFDANNPACSFQFTTVTGGNPNLQPEKSTTLTLGMALEPVKNLSIDVDAFWIFLKNAIVVGGLNYATILQNAQTANEFSAFITRDAAGNIVAIQQTNQNLFKTNVSGVDVDLKYAWDFGDAGKVSFLGNGTYFTKYATQNPDGSWDNQIDLGLTSVSGLISRWRHTATLMYDIAGFNVSVTQNFQKRYHDSLSSITQDSRHVSAVDTFDMQAAYSGVEHFRFQIGIRNLTDRDPPYANYAASSNNFVGGYDLAYGDPRGRFLYGRVTYTFK